MVSLQAMKIRIATERRRTWRDRFLEIARQVEGTAPRSLVVAAGLRLRQRTSAFAVARRAPRIA